MSLRVSLRFARELTRQTLNPKFSMQLKLCEHSVGSPWIRELSECVRLAGKRSRFKDARPT